MKYLTRQVSASASDCRRSLVPDAFSLTHADNEAGKQSTSIYKIGCGLQFTDMQLDANDTIHGAVLKFRCRIASSGTPIRTEISGHLVPNSPEFTTKEDFDNRRNNERTFSYTEWDNLPAWVYNTWYTSPDISSIIHEIVQQSEWVKGNALSLFWDDFSGRSGGTTGVSRRAYSYNVLATSAPLLEIKIRETAYCNVPMIRLTANPRGIIQTKRNDLTVGLRRPYIPYTVQRPIQRVIH